MLLITAGAILLPFGLLTTHRLSLKRDYFFLFLYAQILLYLHIAPTLWAPMVPSYLQDAYFNVQFLSLVLFELPLILIYSPLANTRAPLHGAPRLLRGRPRNQLILSVFAIFFAVLFVIQAVRADVVYLWYGNQSNLNRLNSMDLFAFGIYRSFLLSGNLLSGILAISAVISGGTWTWINRAAFVVLAGSFFVDRMINSRSLPVLLLLLVGGVLHTLSKGKVIQHPISFRFRHVALATLLCLYASHVANLTRALYNKSGGFSVAMFNPLTTVPEHMNPNIDPRFRLNGVDLMARISLTAPDKGFAWTEAWKVPAQVIVMQLFDRDAVKDLKQSFLASPKRFLMLKYTELRAVDYPSCMLTDIYGNFGYLGFPVAAAILAWLLAKTTAGLYCPKSATDVVLALVLYSLVVQFEVEFINIVIGWVRILPIIALVFLVNPFVVFPPAGVAVRARLAKRARQAFPSPFSAVRSR